jgi:hypothetical protein
MLYHFCGKHSIGDKIMKSIFIATLLLFALAGANSSYANSTNEACGGFLPAWQACTQDSDCVVGQNMCGFPAAYNQTALTAVEKYNTCMGPMISCAVPPQEPFTGSVICQNSLCRIIEE